jgi:hypothetical protein
VTVYARLMNTNKPQSAPEPLTELGLHPVEQLLALDPAWSQRIAALHETYRRETSAEAPGDAEEVLPIDIPIDNPDWAAPTLHERARRIDPRTGGSCNAAWGEWISPGERQVQLATCWYPHPQDDFVPDWQMRAAWPEYAHIWEDLLDGAWARHHLMRRAIEALYPSPQICDDDLPF